MIRQMLDFLAEDVGGVRRHAGNDASDDGAGGKFRGRKAVGNFIDMATWPRFTYPRPWCWRRSPTWPMARKPTWPSWRTN